jgi:small subunit ribosomal protein S7
MSRRRAAVKREVLPDPIFGDTMVTKFICTMMQQGKRSSAEKQFYGALELIEKRAAHQKDKENKETPLDVFRLAVENTKPLLEVKSRRVGGANYQVPVEVRPDRRQALSFRWLLQYARKRPGRSMRERLAGEFMDAAMKRGSAVKKREDVHKMADANKAFAHFKW